MGKDSPRARAKLALLKHHDMTSLAIAAMIGVGHNTVNRARAELVEEGLLEKHKHNRPALRTNIIVPPAPLTPEVEEVVSKQASGRLTVDESLDMLTSFARRGDAEGNLTLSRDAIKEFHKLESQATETILGPPDPLTDEDKIERAWPILDVLGPTLAAHAAVQAFPLTEDRAAFEEEYARQSATHKPRTEQRADISGITSSEAAHEEIHKSEEEPPVAQKHEARPSDSGSSDPLD